ncbi:MAG: YihY/virulence factor BrkB family protein [Chloracidobacterium sp.]|nr:YihY/virulence factor BrkB family protein [Chloracidobacterium sp.]
MQSTGEFTWKNFFNRLYDRSFDADVFSRAAQVAFYFSFALFPLLYFLVSLFGLILVSSEGLKSELFVYLNRLMPTAVFNLVKTTVDEIVVNSTGGKATIGLLVTLWSASAGVDAIRNALNDVYKIRDSRYWWRTKAQSVVLTFVFSILATVVVGGVFYGWQLVQYLLAGLGLEVTSPFILVTIQWISIVLLMLLVSEIIYNLLPDFKTIRWVWISPGSIVSILLWIFLTGGFRIYLGYFNSYDRTYGSLGAVIIMMLWLYLTALTLLIGGAINSVLADLNKTDVPE